MKSLTRLLITTGLVLGTAAIAFAAPRSKSPTTLRTQEAFAQLRSGDAVHFACNECRTVTTRTVESADQAMMICKEGSKVTCPMCKVEHKVVLRGRPAARTARHEVAYVNDKGDKCVFIAANLETP